MTLLDSFSLDNYIKSWDSGKLSAVSSLLAGLALLMLFVLSALVL